MNDIWTGLTAIATVAMAYVAIRQFFLRNKQKAIFLSIQMNDLTDDEYRTVRDKILTVIDVTNAMKRVPHVYYYNRNIPTQQSFNKEDFSIQEYMSELRKCDYFIAVITKRVHSSIYFEAGYALARRKRCIFYVKRGVNALPTVMKRSVEIFDKAKTVEFDDLDDAVSKMKQLLTHLNSA